MTKPTRTFSADVGQLSVGNAGPDAIENDIDQLCKMFDPLQDGGGVQAENIAAGAATDTVIGSRTINDSNAPNDDSGVLSILLGWLGNMIKSITGKSSWRTAPATTLEDANEHINATTAHGATSLATGNTMIVRDELGRASIGVPSIAQHIARKDTVDAVQANLDAHGLDYIRNPGFGVTSGTASAFTLTLNPAPTGYVNGMRILVRFHTDPITSWFATINVNGLGPVQLCTSTYDDYGTYYYFPPGMIKAHTHNVYEFVYVGGSNKFVLVGGRTDVMFYRHAQSAVLDHPNGAVTGEKIATGAVDTAQLADGAVTGAKLATAITGAKEFKDWFWINNFGNFGRIAFGTAEDVLATSADGLKFNEALLADRNYVDTVISGINAIASVDGVSNPGGDVDLVGGTGITVTPDAANKKITITATGTATPGPHASSHDAGGSDELAHVTMAAPHSGHETPAGAQAKVNAHASDTSVHISATTNHMYFYVDAVAGNDNNDGLSIETAFATINKAISLIPRIVDHAVEILIVPGVYNEDVKLNGYIGKGDMVIVPYSYTGHITVNSLQLVNCGIYIYVRYFEAVDTNMAGVSVMNCIDANFEDLKVVTASASYVSGIQAYNSNCYLEDCEVSNRGKGIAARFSKVVSYNSSGVNNNVGLYASDAGIISKYGTQPQGATAESVSGGLII